MRQQWGCEQPAPVAVWDDPEIGMFFNCPLQFVPATVCDWYDEYAYYQEFSGAAPGFLEQSAKFVDAMRIYVKQFNDCLAKIARKKSSQTDGLNILKERFNGRRK
jgi:hypothetical protein